MNVQQVCNSPRLTHQGMETLMSSQERPQIIAAMPAASDSSSIASSARSATANVNRQNQAAQNPAGNSSPVASNPNNEQASQEVKSQDGNTIPPNQLAQNLQSQLNQSQPLNIQRIVLQNSAPPTIFSPNVNVNAWITKFQAHINLNNIANKKDYLIAHLDTDVVAKMQNLAFNQNDQMAYNQAVDFLINTYTQTRAPTKMPEDLIA